MLWKNSFTVCPCLKNTFFIEFRLVAASDNSWDFHDFSWGFIMEGQGRHDDT